jgi:Caspase domain
MADGTADFAIVIGILYFDSDLPKLEGTVADAKDFYEWLIEDAGVPNEHIELLLSDPNQLVYPQKDDIDGAFLTLFEKAKRHGNPRRFYMYFAGHGAASKNDELCLIMANASKNTLNRCLNTLSYHQWLKQQALFLEQLFFYDCCYLFDQRVEGMICPFTNPDPNPKNWKPDSQTVQVVQHFFYASKFTQKAYERSHFSSTNKRGHFTKALMEGLRGAAIKKKLNLWMITTDCLGEYISRRVAHLAAAYKDYQQPEHLRGDPIELIEAREPKLYDINVKITPIIQSVYCLAIYNRNLSLFDKKFLSSEQAEFTLNLPSGVYTLTIEAEDKRIRESDPIDLLPSIRDGVSVKL